MNAKPNIVIIGGGLAGLINAIVLAKAGFEVKVIERKSYPFHKVCGEYISNEVLPFLKTLGLNPEDWDASKISNLKISAPNGKSLSAKLDLGAFGISRYQLDFECYQLAKSLGVNFLLNTKVLDVSFLDEKFEIETPTQKIKADLIIGAFGKRSNLDQKLNRKFFYQRSPYLGVKYHIQTDFPKNLIQLDNFEGGYCGISKIEKDFYCLCYLAENKHLKNYGSIPVMEENILYQNPLLKNIFKQSHFLWKQPETINEISFEQKSLIENHILMCGDTAGMIAPLCGNGMAIAIHSAKILAEEIIEQCSEGINPKKRATLENRYQQKWHREFALRLKIGRGIQNIFGNKILTSLAVSSLRKFPSLTQKIIRKTHGKPF
ncbi:MAG: NAD(P)/FAD-dependent oxidoreductase [Bacteroidetes bacterium]|nr:NAD(P)/FAD-dependent oxidoreductase [Bacteroidota bacterium]MBU1373482.1 NAD(P)/FAD-dependent oxidoreductase [Bacteroidota bacterium]MBU1485240.1 NAD(P)/FAD-dependent oxidoreductase [Bacteroidota bacterium]MBU1760756.1 NAD(P)/FAD-dependent oxidoreductase [Bacteroidota bacterium]MBU2267798.1 NAD(P)/FAD-dependent oxidoreductase [Bacteroidota bacterium]